MLTLWKRGMLQMLALPADFDLGYYDNICTQSTCFNASLTSGRPQCSASEWPLRMPRRLVCGQQRVWCTSALGFIVTALHALLGFIVTACTPLTLAALLQLLMLDAQLQQLLMRYASS